MVKKTGRSPKQLENEDKQLTYDTIGKGETEERYRERNDLDKNTGQQSDFYINIMDEFKWIVFQIMFSCILHFIIYVLNLSLPYNY